MVLTVLILVSSLSLNLVSVEMRITVETLLEECQDLKEKIICDPAGILNSSVDTIIKEITTTSTTLTCQNESSHCQSKDAGCNMYIVVSEGMKNNFKHNHLLEEAKRFATELMGLVASKCGNSFLLYYSYQDHVFYVVTEKGVEKKLQNELIGEIALMNKKHLSRNLTHGLIQIIKEFRLVFVDKYVSELHFNKPRYQAAKLMGKAQKADNYLLYLVTQVLCIILSVFT